MATPESLSRLEFALRRIARDLRDLGRQWALAAIVAAIAAAARAGSVDG